jgi:hypothetical protein
MSEEAPYYAPRNLIRAIGLLAMSIVVGCSVIAIAISEAMDSPQASEWRVWGMIVGIPWIWGFTDFLRQNRKR